MFIRAAERNEEGASAVEYGLIVAAIAAVIVAIVFLLGGVVEDTYRGSCDRIAGTAASASVISNASC
jgi:pilus assembly protein Flp/PilA